MSYHRPPRMPGWGPRRGPGGASSDFGAFGAVGDVVGELLVDSAVRLAQQVNRFGPGAPAGRQLVDQAFPLAPGTISPALALAAVVIYQRRATDAYSQFHDAGSAQAITAANLAFADPVTFVNQHLADVISTIASYADSLGLPGPTSDGGADVIAGLSTRTLLLAAGGALLLWVVMR